MMSSQIMLVFTTIMTLAYTFPTEGIENNFHTKIQENAAARSSYQSERPSVIRAGNKNPTDKPELIQFVFKSQDEKSKVETIGTDREKYTVNQINDQKISKETPNPDVAKKEFIQSKENTNINATGIQKNDSRANSGKTEAKEKFSSSQIEYNIEQKWPFTAVEMSPIIGGWPKYFFDLANPVHPFPEIAQQKSSQNAVEGIKTEKERTVQQRKTANQPPETAGPLLNPLSIYSREFDIPFFD